jgi:L-aspartate oxidase
LIPVSPAAHYICGGIKTNEYGETNIQNLLAFGECACTEVHGANRLASNSLLESVVFSSLGALKARKLLKNGIEESKIGIDRLFCDVPEQELKMLRAELRKAMWNHVGITRNEKGLNQMLTMLKQLEKRIAALNEKTVNVQILELKNMLLVCNLITKAALEREESRGTHYREDYPQINDKNWLKHICLKGNGKDITLSFV